MLRDTFYSIERLAELREERLQRQLRKPRPGPAERKPHLGRMAALTRVARIARPWPRAHRSGRPDSVGFPRRDEG
jgi:hypothetical protein